MGPLPKSNNDTPNFKLLDKKKLESTERTIVTKSAWVCVHLSLYLDGQMNNMSICKSVDGWVLYFHACPWPTVRHNYYTRLQRTPRFELMWEEIEFVQDSPPDPHTAPHFEADLATSHHLQLADPRSTDGAWHPPRRSAKQADGQIRLYIWIATLATAARCMVVSFIVTCVNVLDLLDWHSKIA